MRARRAARHRGQNRSLRGGTAGIRVVVAGMPWPVETFIDRLLTGLALAGHELIVLSDTRPSNAWLEHRRATWWPGPIALDHRRAASTILRSLDGDVIDTATDVARHVGRLPGPIDADVIYAPWINALTTFPGLFDLGIPVVTSCRGALITIAPWNPRREEHRARLGEVFERSTLVHCVSDAIRDAADELGLDSSKARVIRPAVDLTTFTPAQDRGTDTTFRVVGTGRLTWLKAYEHALVAVAKAAALGIDISFHLIGDGPDRQHLQYVADDLGLGSRLELVGACSPDEVRQALQRADTFLHMSSSEGISNAVLEAMATGLPVVTTAVGGMGEAVRDGVEGFLVPVRDSDAASRALANLAADPELRRRIGAAGRARVETSFRLADQVAAFDRLLREACRGN